MTQLSLYLWLSTRKVSVRSVSLTSVKCDTNTSSLAPALAKFISTIAQPHPYRKSWTWMSTLQTVPSVLHWQSTHTLPGLLHLLSCQQYWRDSLKCADAHSSSTSQSDGLIPPPLLHLRRCPNSAKAEVPFLHHKLKGPLVWWFCWDFSFFCAYWWLCTLALGPLSIPDSPPGDGFVAPKFNWMCGIKFCNAWWFQSNTHEVVEGFGVERRTPVCFGSLEPTESSLAFCCWDWQCQDQVHQGEEVTVAGVQTIDLGQVQSGKSLLPIPPAVHVCFEAGPLVVQLAHFKSWLDHRLEVLGQNQGVTGLKHSAHLKGLCRRQLSSKFLPCSLIWC